MTPRQMRVFAVVVLFFGFFAAGLAVANIIGALSGSWFWTVVPLVVTVSAFGLAYELWYVSRRIERGSVRPTA